MNLTIEELKQRFSIEFIWYHFDLPGDPAKFCRSPFREDKNPSFSVWHNGTEWRWNDFSTGEHGDVIDFVAKAKAISIGEAINYLRSLSGSRPNPVRSEVKRSKEVKSDMVLPGHIVSLPYAITRQESLRCRKACESLASDCDIQQSIASWGGWKPETIRDLALDCCLGWEDDKLVYIFETGMQSRGYLYGADRNFRWEFGKPFLWRGYPLLDKLLNPFVETVFITEGQSDLIRFLNDGIEEIDLSVIGVAIPGAGQFRNEWAEMFRGKQVFLIPDADEAGKGSADKLANMLQPVAKEVQITDINKLQGAST